MSATQDTTNATPNNAGAAPTAPTPAEKTGFWSSTKKFLTHPGTAYTAGAVLAVGAGYAGYRAGVKLGAEKAHMSLSDAAASLQMPPSNMAG